MRDSKTVWEEIPGRSAGKLGMSSGKTSAYKARISSTRDGTGVAFRPRLQLPKDSPLSPELLHEGSL